MMKRTVALVLCLVSLFPAAGVAQDTTGAPREPAAAERTVGEKPLLQPDLYRIAQTDGRMLVAQTDTQEPARARETRDSSCSSFRDFAEIHFGGYRWVWWALAAGALIAIHAAQ